MSATTTKLAEKFSCLLRSELTNEEIAIVVERNASEDSPLVCHSHDFCDANEVMAEAFEAIVDHTLNGDDDADTALWNEAWEIAISNRFWNRTVK